MNEIVIISGKGGSGKTSISAGLAAMYHKQLLLGDCDVDAADMHLLMMPNHTVSEDFYSGKLPIFDNDKCINCGICVDYCTFDALTKEDTIQVNPIDCEGCGLCSHLCPKDAISMETQKVGSVYKSTSRFDMPLVHAKLDPGADNSGKLVTHVKKISREIANNKGIDHILIDGPPGIGCPVIASLSGASSAIIVTEPSVSGYSDMVRVHELLVKMNIKGYIVINKKDLNNDIFNDIHSYSKENNLTVIGELPYHINFSKSISEGKAITEHGYEDIDKEFEKMWEAVNCQIYNK